MEISVVRRRVLSAMAAARERSHERRARTAEAERDYERFLAQVAVPVTKLVGNVLKAEGLAFTVFTPNGRVRLASDRSRDDYVELQLDADQDPPQVVGLVSRTRGSRTFTDERPIAEPATPGTLTEEDVLRFLLDAMHPWLER